MFTRTFWRYLSVVSAAGAGWFLVHSLRTDTDDSAPTRAVKATARKAVRRAAAKAEAEVSNNGDARRAH